MADYDLTQGPINRHIRHIAVPASIGMFFHTMYNVVDTFYAGRISTEALAGMTLSFPIFFLVMALSFGVGNGTTALSAIALGRKDTASFHRLAYNAVAQALLLSALAVVTAPLTIPFLFSLSGAAGDELTLGIQYTKTIFFGVIFFFINNVINGLLNAQGDSKSYRNFLIIGFVLNLILDPLFIFGWFGLPRLGTVGVALATVIVQLIGTVYLIYCLHKSPVFQTHDFLSASLSITELKDLTKQGLPASLNMGTIALGVYIINYFVLAYAPGPATIAGYGASMRVEQIALLPALGLNTAALSIAGQNYGAGKFQRVFDVKRTALIIAITIMVLAALIIYPLAPWFIGLFNSDPLVVAAGTAYLRIEVFAFPTYVILSIYISIMQGVKKPTYAVWIGLYRQILLPFILFRLLGTVFELGINGVWWGIVLINWSAVAITIIYNRMLFAKIFANAG